MAIAPGTRLGPYTITASLGAGGMGEVYRARDARLGRDVAVKVLPAEVASDADRRARFEREARAVAALSHPNILALFDIGTEGDRLYVVTELLGGESLAERMTRGPLPVRKAVEYAVAIARGLAEAHGKSIAHRDLKPANVFLTADGQLKILDFGLAREVAHATIGATATQPALTDPGTILGTAAYMAPEQIRGQPVDGRADLFALGIVLHEMLTGTRAFARESTIETLNAILKDEPKDLTTTRADIPPALDRIVRHCLEKNPTERFQTARDVAFALEGLVEKGQAATRVLGRPWSSRPVAMAVTLVTVGAAMGSLVSQARFTGARIPKAATTRAVLPLSDPLELDTGRPALAISPDGTRIAYVGNRGGKRQLFLRRLDAFDASPILGTEGASGPFFSPNGQRIGFVDDWELKTIPADGGAPVSVTGLTPMTRGLAWLGEDTFIHNTDVNGPLQRVVSGALGLHDTTLDQGRGERSHRWPSVLPGRRAVLFTAGTGQDFDTARIGVLTLDNQATKVVIEGGTSPRYVSSGHLLFARAGSLMAVPFDLDRLEVRGEPRAMVESITVDDGGAAQYDVSENGTLIYVRGLKWAPRRSMVWVSGDGAEESLAAPLRAYTKPAISPRGSEIAVSIPEGSASDIWLYSLARRTLNLFTSDPGEDECPVWEPEAIASHGARKWRGAHRNSTAGGSTRPRQPGVFSPLSATPQTFPHLMRRTAPWHFHSSGTTSRAPGSNAATSSPLREKPERLCRFCRTAS